MQVSSVGTPPVGPNIVKAWFETAINPLLSGLESEAALLRNRNFTWRWHTGQMIAILPVRDHLFSYRSSANFNQFLRFYRDSAGLCDKHDVQVTELADTCRKFFDSLIADQEFRALVNATVLSLPDYESPPAILEWTAEHVVNGSGELPAHYVTAPLWNALRGEFSAFRAQGPNYPLSDRLDEIGRHLLRTVTDLMSSLDEARESLSLSSTFLPSPWKLAISSCPV